MNVTHGCIVKDEDIPDVWCAATNLRIQFSLVIETHTVSLLACLLELLWLVFAKLAELALLSCAQPSTAAGKRHTSVSRDNFSTGACMCSSKLRASCPDDNTLSALQVTLFDVKSRTAELECGCNLFAGNITTVGSLLFNSAYLAPFLGGSSAASQNISDILSQINLTPNDTKEALAAACTLGLQQWEPKAVAVLASAAMSASDTSGIQIGFANVSLPGCMCIGSPHVESA